MNAPQDPFEKSGNASQSVDPQKAAIRSLSLGPGLAKHTPMPPAISVLATASGR